MTRFPIPDEALDDRLAILGTAGAGKTYLALTAIERLLTNKARVVFVDALGVGWGLRLMADGKTSSPFNIPIFGGAHGDLPINEHAGAVIGETVARMRESCILDLSGIGTKAAERRFMLAFLTSLYRNATKEPLHLIVDEADMWAPQRLLDKDGDAAKLLGMMETIVRRGRVFGFIPWLITQRPAVLSKDVLSQADGLIALKLTSSQDRDAIGAWIEGQADKSEGKAILASLPSMQRGHGILWMPTRGILKTVEFPAKQTFDSSRTPKRGEKRHTAELKALDLGALKERLATVEAETKANDPRALKAEIAELKRQMSQAVTRRVVGDPNTGLKDREAAFGAGKKEGFSEGYVDGDRDGFARGAAVALDQSHAAIQTAMKAFVGVAFVAPKRLPKVYVAKADIAPTKPIERRIVAPAPAVHSNGHDDLSAPQRRVMASLAFWKSIGHEMPTREQVAAVAGYRPGSGNFNNLVGGLSATGRTNVPQPGRLSLASEYEALTVSEAKEKLWSVFENPQRKLVQAALDASGDMARDDLASNAGYAPGSGNFNNLAGSLTSMDVLQRSGQGRLQISDWAREVLS